MDQNVETERLKGIAAFLSQRRPCDGPQADKVKAGARRRAGT